MISRHFNAAGFVAVLIAMAVNVASAQSNVALVVGNDAYQHGKPLSTTVADVVGGGNDARSRIRRDRVARCPAA